MFTNGKYNYYEGGHYIIIITKVTEHWVHYTIQDVTTDSDVVIKESNIYIDENEDLYILYDCRPTRIYFKNLLRAKKETPIQCSDCGTMSELFYKHQGVSMGGVLYDINIGKCCEKFY